MPEKNIQPPCYQQADDIRVKRLENNPIIRPEMLDGDDGKNINGPCLIRVPDWVKNPLGKYYLYFAHHGGSYLRMAYADKLGGLWKIYDGGVLRMSELHANFSHIASPDIFIDHNTKQIRLYFHGHIHETQGQHTYIALSDDGLNFSPQPEAVGIFYFRVFNYKEKFYAIAHSGLFYTSDDGFTFEKSHYLFDTDAASSPRHVAVDLQANTLWLYHSNIGDKPERILRSKVELTDNPSTWRACDTREILRPELPYEGVNLPIITSKSGYTDGEHALRDPHIFNEADKKYLLYSVTGESGIAIAQIDSN